MIIGFTGPKLSGKGTAAQFLQKTHGAAVYSMSGILSDILDRLHLPKTREHMIAVVTDLRARFGEDILAQVLQKDLQEENPTLGIIDGIRMPKEVDIFSQLPGFYLVYIDAPVRVRYERALGRGEKEGESTMTYEQFLAEEQAVTEQNIVSLKEKANLVIENTSDVAALYSQLDQFIGSYR